VFRSAAQAEILAATPRYPGEKVEHDELLGALQTSQQIIDGAAELLPHLGIFPDA
jgi:hypothetical protein